MKRNNYIIGENFPSPICEKTNHNENTDNKKNMLCLWSVVIASESCQKFIYSSGKGIINQDLIKNPKFSPMIAEFTTEHMSHTPKYCSRAPHSAMGSAITGEFSSNRCAFRRAAILKNMRHVSRTWEYISNSGVISQLLWKHAKSFNILCLLFWLEINMPQDILSLYVPLNLTYCAIDG